MLPLAATSSLAATLTYSMNVGESIEYDVNNNRLVIGSLSTGRIIGIPLPDGSASASFDSSTVHTYFAGSADVFATVGLQVDGDEPCYLYAALGGYPSRTSSSGVQMGVATIDLCNDTLAYFTNLTSLATTGGSMGNDLTKVGDVLYVTDFLGDQLLAVSGQNTASPVVSKVIDFVGANGIEHIGDVLIIASFSGCSLYRYDTTTGAGASITLTPSVPVCGDGVYFDSSRTTLYVTNGGGSYAGQVRQSSCACVISCDGSRAVGWQSDML